MHFCKSTYSVVADFFKKAMRPFKLAFICFTHPETLYQEELFKIRVLISLWKNYKLLVIFLAICNLCSGPFSFLLLFILFPLKYGFRLFFLFNLLVILLDYYLIYRKIPMPLSRELFLLFVSTEACHERYTYLIKTSK
jgi:hypothetical protein